MAVLDGSQREFAFSADTARELKRILTPAIFQLVRDELAAAVESFVLESTKGPQWNVERERAAAELRAIERAAKGLNHALSEMTNAGRTALVHSVYTLADLGNPYKDIRPAPLAELSDAHEALLRVLPDLRKIRDSYGRRYRSGPRVARKRLAWIVALALARAGVPIPKSVAKPGRKRSQYEEVMAELLYAAGDDKSTDLFRLLKHGADTARKSAKAPPSRPGRPSKK